MSASVMSSSFSRGHARLGEIDEAVLRRRRLDHRHRIAVLRHGQPAQARLGVGRHSSSAPPSSTSSDRSRLGRRIRVAVLRAPGRPPASGLPCPKRPSSKARRSSSSSGGGSSGSVGRSCTGRRGSTPREGGSRICAAAGIGASTSPTPTNAAKPRRDADDLALASQRRSHEDYSSRERRTRWLDARMCWVNALFSLPVRAVNGGPAQLDRPHEL